MDVPGIVAAAARNNAQWCAAMWASHLLPVEQVHGMLLTRASPPPFYPNAVTTEASAAAEQAAFLADLASGSGAFAVKDSFGVLQLEAFGFSPLFQGRWLWRRWEQADETDLAWRRVTSADVLQQWEESWNDGAADPVKLFRPVLLDNPGVVLLAGYDERDRIVGGGVAFVASGVLGMTNVFGNDRDFCSAAVRETGINLLVRYETGPLLRAALDEGFCDVGPMLVWGYAP